MLCHCGKRYSWCAPLGDYELQYDCRDDPIWAAQRSDDYRLTQLEKFKT